MNFETIEYNTDLCIIGGGFSGLCTAISAARNGSKVVLMQDRPMLGGNASSEIRMWIEGAHGNDNTESGLLEEIKLSNYYYNPKLKYNIWDDVLYNTAYAEKNLEIIFNCSCLDVETSNNKISSVTGWQLTTQSYRKIFAKNFADCSGDSVLRKSGAEFMRGEEAKSTFNESYAPVKATNNAMGNSILVMVREVKEHVKFIAPPFARKYTDENAPKRPLTPTGHNFWWLEIGGNKDSIKDAETLSHDLLAIAYGIWEYIKNHPDGRGHNWELDWIGSLPGKRENIRYVGDYVLNQNDVEAEGKFDDIIAYGGWSMDNHHPLGIETNEKPTIFYPAPSPYGIPFRSLYSKNIDNLVFAGRNISASHLALSSTRVMATCALLGQALGTAMALANKYNCSARDIYNNHISELQQVLMNQDSYLPWQTRKISSKCLNTKILFENPNIEIMGDINNLRNGIDRNLGDSENGLWIPTNTSIIYEFEEINKIEELRLIFDSDFSIKKQQPCKFTLEDKGVELPKMLVKEFIVELKINNEWKIFVETKENYKRFVKLSIKKSCEAIKFTPIKNWGHSLTHIFSFDFN